MKRFEQIVAIFIAAGLSIPSYWFFWTLAGGGGYDRRVPIKNENPENVLKPSSNFNKP
tara:strand:- start:1445 stop:1618 length:174 start_codon:yes stop_codon:yes gene_type:complete